MISKQYLAAAVSAFGVAAKAKLSAKAITGAPEDQLRGPLETLLQDMGAVLGKAAGSVVTVGETTLAVKARPDFAITVGGALAGFMEVKAPGKGADPRAFTDKHDRSQWDKLKSLPNLIYTDGNAFSRWQDGKLAGAVIHLEGDIATAGAKLVAPASLERLFSDFLGWKPIAPTSAVQLAEVSARLCRLLRDEVTEQLTAGNKALTNLAEDWRKLLFPHATDAAFADGYAQAVTFGLLVARAQNIPVTNGLEAIAKALGQATTVIGSAFRVLTDDVDNQAALKTSLDTLTRVLGVVDWAKISEGEPEAWLYFYEHFLAVYDNVLRKRTGSYYTPPGVVTAMVRLVDDVLRDPNRFGVSSGLASPEVTLADPAVGTGTYLLGVLRRIAEATEEDQGAGQVPPIVQSALKRLIGFEMQFGPFAVAQLRLLAEVAVLAKLSTAKLKTVKLRLHITDTLGNPAEAVEYIPSILKPLAASRLEANTIKRYEPIMIVIGNPPYKEKAQGLGGWIEGGKRVTKKSKGLIASGKAPLERWMPPSDWGVGQHTKHLRNLYIYFWRWATWKVFGDSASQEGTQRKGVVSFITVAGFLNGDGFQAMRDDLRRSCDEIWVVDCSPDGHQSDVPTRIFQGVQQPVCIVMASRTAQVDAATPARVRFQSLPKGDRQLKFDALASLTLDNDKWLDCPSDWRAPFLPAIVGSWATYPPLAALFTYNGSGVMPGRTWVIAPDAVTLDERWMMLVNESDPARKESLFHPHIRGGDLGDKHSKKRVLEGLRGHEHRVISVAGDSGPPITPTRYGYRSFDRQYIIPDARVINQPNPTLWDGYSTKQVYITALARHAPTSGPAITFTCLIPDHDHYKGSFAGRVFPLWTDGSAKQSNVRGPVVETLTKTYGVPVTPEDVIAYVAAVMAHPAYVAKFGTDLIQPGLRIPITTDAAVFADAIKIGCEVVWLHTFGERFASAAQGRPAAPPRMAKGKGPTNPIDGEIPSDEDGMPETVSYDPSAQRLRIGTGFIDNVSPDVWAYQVSGKQVLLHWFSYRGKDRSRPTIGDKRPPSPLSDIQPKGWLPEYTTELLNVLHVLGRLVALEPAQADLLKRVCDGPTLAGSALQATAAADIKPVKKARQKTTAQMSLLDAS